jgi:PAS domain S-box-containing protein
VVIDALNSGADFYLKKGGQPTALFTELLKKIQYAVSHRQAEKILPDSRENITDIIEFLPDAIFAINISGVITLWNRAMEEMIGISKDEMIGQGDHAYSLPFYGERRHQLLDLLDKDDEEIRSKYLSIRKNGHTLYVEVFTPALFGGKGAYLWAIGSPLFDRHGIRIGAIESIRDITRYKKTEIELLKKNEELQAANEEIITTELELRNNLEERTRQELALRINEKRLLMAQEIGQTGYWEYNHKPKKSGGL